MLPWKRQHKQKYNLPNDMGLQTTKHDKNTNGSPAHDDELPSTPPPTWSAGKGGTRPRNRSQGHDDNDESPFDERFSNSHAHENACVEQTTRRDDSLDALLAASSTIALSYAHNATETSTAKAIPVVEPVKTQSTTRQLEKLPLLSLPPHQAEKGDHDSKSNTSETSHWEHGILPKDSISFFVTVAPLARGFWIALWTLAVQVFVLILLSVDSIDRDGGNTEYPTNWLQVPATSTMPVTLAQFLALTIASLTQYDVVQAIVLVYVGFDAQKIQAGILDRDNGKGDTEGDNHAPHGDDEPDDEDVDHLFNSSYLKFRWYLAVSLRFGIGFSAGVVTFMLVARSETVRDVMLDFTAIEFVAKLDEVVFMLSSFGFFGRPVKRATEGSIYTDGALTRDVPMESHLFAFGFLNTAFILFLRTITFWVNFGLMMTITVRQYNGYYVPDKLLVQMGDERSSLLSTYTGIYELSAPRFGYIEYNERGGTGVFKWCESQQAWTFLESSDSDCGSHWTLKSIELDQYGDMLTVANEPWYILEQNNIKLRVQHMSIFSMFGVEVDCPRDGSQYDWTCRFSDPCPAIAVDENFGAFRGRRTWPTSFSMIPDLLVYRQPVYYYRESSDRNPDLILFTGRQWVMLSTSSWLNVDQVDDDYVWLDEEIRSKLTDLRIYRFEGDFGVRFLSEVVDLGTKNDRGTPAGLQWFAADLGGGAESIPVLDERIVVEQRFYCAVCNENSGRVCFYGAPCVNGTCVCDGENLGSRCELVPSNDATCNPSFNNAEFDFDGGDCCASSCEDTLVQTCLKSEEDQLIDYGNSLCRDRQSGFRRQKALNEPDFTGTWLNAVTVAPGISLTQDGRTMALSYRLIEETIFMTRVGTSWIQSGITHTFGGFYNEIVSLFPGSIGGPSRRLPIKGVAASYSLRGISPFVCDGLGCVLGSIQGPNSTLLRNSIVPSDFVLANYWDAFALSNDGLVLARGASASESGRYQLNIFHATSRSSWMPSGESIGLAVNRTEIVASYFVPIISSTVVSATPSPTTTPVQVYPTDSILPTQVPATNGVPACEFLAAWFGRTVDAWSDVHLINNFPFFDISNMTTADFVSSVNDVVVTDFNIRDFNATQYIRDECVPDLVEIPVYGQVLSQNEAPLYVSLSGLRPDGSRRVVVGSVKFKQRAPSELSKSLAVHVYEIFSDRLIQAQSSSGVVLDQSDIHGRSTNNATGIPNKAVSISDDGNFVAVGSLYFRNDTSGNTYEAAIVKVFSCSDGNWTTRQEIELGRNDTTPQVRDGWSNKISADGSILSVSFPLKSAIYRWNGTVYQLDSPELAFASGADVAMSLHGSTVGFAVPLRGGFGAFAYTSDEAPWCKETTQKELHISFTPLSKQNFTWRLYAPSDTSDDDRQGEVVVEAGGWPVSTEAFFGEGNPYSSPDPTLRHLQLDVEREYEVDDPTGLTFTYTRCIDAQVCAGVYRDSHNAVMKNLGVVFDGRRILTNEASSAVHPTCRLTLSATPQTELL